MSFGESTIRNKTAAVENEFIELSVVKAMIDDSSFDANTITDEINRLREARDRVNLRHKLNEREVQRVKAMIDDSSFDANTITDEINRLREARDRVNLRHKLNEREVQRVKAMIDDSSFDANTITDEINRLREARDRIALREKLKERESNIEVTADNPITNSTSYESRKIRSVLSPTRNQQDSPQVNQARARISPNEQTSKNEYEFDPNSLEARLQQMYSDENIDIMAAKPIERAGVAAILASNEGFPNGELIPPRTPDGYIIGVGNGAIWSMLELFDKENPPKGIVSLDIDPPVILSGMVLVELAKRGISPAEAISYLYSDMVEEPGYATYHNHTVEDLMKIAQELINKEPNTNLQSILQKALRDPNFKKDIAFASQRHVLDYKKPKFEGSGRSERRGRLNTASILLDHWSTIVKLAQEGKIFFAHSDLTNKQTLDFIAQQIPDAAQLTNVIYTTNVLDHFSRAGMYDANLSGLEIFNPQGKSFYVSTRTNKGYNLEISDTPPQM